MTWHLNTDISFCELDGRLFFLDLQNDRYFQLSRALEQKFLSHLEAPGDAGINVSGLIKYGLLLQTPTAPHGRPAADIALPDQSTLETPCSDRHIPLNVVREIFLIVAMMHWQLKVRHLKLILQTLSDYRDSRTSPFVDDQVGLRQRLLQASTTFNRVRPYVPIGTCCLIDSLSMVRFLAKHGLHAHLVMGIACDPFSAHAWVQHGPLVLNETVGMAQAHVPIRII